MDNHTDTRLTDYALGELDEAARREMQARLDADPELRQAAVEIGMLGQKLRSATQTDADHTVVADDALRAALVERLGRSVDRASEVHPAPSGRRSAIWAAAASIAVLLTGVGAVAWINVGDANRSPMALVDSDEEAVPAGSLLGEASKNQKVITGIVTTEAPNAVMQARRPPTVDSPPTSLKADVGAVNVFTRDGATTFAASVPDGTLGDRLSTAEGLGRTLNLSGNNSYSGGTVVTAGTPNKSAAGTLTLPTSATPASPLILNPTPKPYAEPQFVPYVNNLQTFDQPDLTKGTGTRPADGWFGSVEYLNWAFNSQNKPATAATEAAPPLDPAAELGYFEYAEPQTGRVVLGVGVNSNAGVVGGVVVDERAREKVSRDVSRLRSEREQLAASVGPQHPQLKQLDSGIKRLEDLQRQQTGQGNTEAYDAIVENAFLKTADAPLSTFSIDVDTASYSNVRRILNGGQLPPPGAVRLEEFINYFTYDYPQPTGDDPFAVTTEAARCPWNGEHVLVRVGLKGKEIHRKERPATNLVFLVDVSGSMEPANKLPLVRESLKMLVNELGDSDRVAMVVYAGSTGLVLPSTGGDRKQTILEAIDRLQAGGSTNGAAGITLAYQQAAEHFIEGGVNRVVLATDGDFNVGVTNQSELVNLIEAKAKSGVFFSALGYGYGNLKDSTLEKLADKGNGNYAYIDTLKEAKKVLVEQMSGTLVTIAKDVKVQIEFNPTRVAAYRLLGYENRILAAQDFNDDKKDAGEIGAGHTVTALYELIPAGGPAAAETKKLPAVDPLKYQQLKQTSEPSDAAKSAELLTLKLRYKQPDGDTSKLIERPLADDVRSYAQASGDFKFAASVAAFGMLLRHSAHSGSATFDAVLELAQEGIGADRGGYRDEFIGLVRKARELSPQVSR